MHVFSKLSAKAILFIAIIVVLLLAIPLTLYLLQSQQQTKSNAAQSTKIYTDPPTATVVKGQTVDLKIMVDPGSDPSTANVISTVTINISYNTDLLQPTDPQNCIDVKGGALSQQTTPVTCTTGSGLVHLAAASTTEFIQTSTGPKQVAMLHFTAKAAGTAQVSFGALTTAGSSSDRDPENNVIIPNTGMQGSTITITDAPITGTPTPITPTPTGVVVQPPTAVPTQIPVPLCTNFTSSQGSGGMAPFSTTFTATGNAQAPGASLTKASFSFGDGQSQDVAGSASASINHIYNTAGNYRAFVTFTDTNGTVSQAGSCSLAIVVKGQGGTGTNGGDNGNGGTGGPTPTMGPTGPGETILGIGAAGTILMIIGGALFFLL